MKSEILRLIETAERFRNAYFFNVQKLFAEGYRSPDFYRLRRDFSLTDDETYDILDDIREIEMTSPHDFEVFEDNGGGLYLVVLIDGIPTYIFEGWECGEAGNLAEAVSDLRENIFTYQHWDGDVVYRVNAGFPNPEDFMTAESLYDDGLGDLIAHFDEGGATYYVPRMGIAARKAFGFSEEDE